MFAANPAAVSSKKQKGRILTMRPLVFAGSDD
jgi:hypothetical protein